MQLQGLEEEALFLEELLKYFMNVHLRAIYQEFIIYIQTILVV